MAKTDWDSAAKLFALENERTGISVQDWCERNGLNYQSARRYLKTRAQSATTNKTSRVQTTYSTKNPKKNAQTAQKSLRKSNAQNNDICADSQSAAKKPQPGRDANGHFLKGHNIPECTGQNLENLTPFQPGDNIGNQSARTHGGYAKHFEAPELFDEVDELTIIDEIRFVRARILFTTKSLNAIKRDLEIVESLSERVSLYESLVRAEQALDRNIARVESLTRTLSGLQLDKSKLRLDDVMEPKIVADTEKSRSQKRKLDAETAKIERDQGGDTTPLDEIVGDLQEMGSGGLMS